MPAHARFASKLESPFVNKKALPLRSEVYEIAHDLSGATGEVQACWFIANPNGPTAFAIGYIDADDRRLLFYRWLHFLRSRTWIIGSVDPQVDVEGEEFGAAFHAALVAAQRHFLDGEADEQPILGSLPSFVFCAKNQKLVGWFLRHMFAMHRGQDWSRLFHGLELYGPQFFDLAAHQAREAYEDARHRGGLNEYWDFIWARHQHFAPFAEWKPTRLDPVPLDEAALLKWFDLVTSRDYCVEGIGQFKQMWVGAAHLVADTVTADAKRGGTYVSFSDLARFFSDFRFPVFPVSSTDDSVRQAMGLEAKDV